ncbi:MAG: hypothetical protein PUP46_10250 [Endozoicomonas sp. (ex Botrylloides leachii)]|nr:hypothetical protein [Endozoicomonas sp. (ex Botrylloides leachii)]
MSLMLEQLEKGDILISCKKNEHARTALISHALLVANNVATPSGIVIQFFDITTLGFCKKYFRQSLLEKWSVFAYRLSGNKIIAGQAATIGNFWISQCPHIIDGWHIVSPNIYSISSICSSFLGNPCFGPKAIKYVTYLNKTCQYNPPKEFTPRSVQWFSGVICTFLPIALYQSYLGVEKSYRYMAIDAKKSLPRDLAIYLHNNPSWKFIGNS